MLKAMAKPIQAQAFSRYRPRFLTLLLLCIIAGTVTLVDRGRFPHVGRVGGRFEYSYGWPLRWRHYALGAMNMDLISDGYYRAGRLAANAVIWLMIAAVSAILCEWLTRRYSPKVRWNWRMVPIAVGVLAALCGWFAAAHHQANVEDGLAAAVNARGGTVRVKRWGPNWLDLGGAERYRQRIIGADFYVFGDGHDQETGRLLKRLAAATKLRYLVVVADQPIPDIIDSLNEMPHVRALSIEHPIGFRGDERKWSHNWVKALGRMTDLEHLRLGEMKLFGDDLANLASMTKLKSLCLNGALHGSDEHGYRPADLSSLPALPQLEFLELKTLGIGDDDLRQLTKLPRLKSLNIDCWHVTDAGLRHIAALPQIEELAIRAEMVSPTGQEALSETRNLKKLHISPDSQRSGRRAKLALGDGSATEVPDDQLEACTRALEELRRCHPGIIIDNENYMLDWYARYMTSGFDELPRYRSIDDKIRSWKREGGKPRWRW